MRPTTMRRLAAGAVIVGALVPAGAGAATACDGTHNDVRGISYTVRQDVRAHRLLSVASTYLGLSRDAIRAQLVAGKSLADIANATPGKSAAGLVGAYSAAIKIRLDHAVAEGWLTSAKEQVILTRIQPWLVRLVNFHWPHA